MADWLKALVHTLVVLTSIAILIGLVYALAFPNPTTHTAASLEAGVLLVASIILLTRDRRRKP